MNAALSITPLLQFQGSINQWLRRLPVEPVLTQLSVIQFVCVMMIIYEMFHIAGLGWILFSADYRATTKRLSEMQLHREARVRAMADIQLGSQSASARIVSGVDWALSVVVLGLAGLNLVGLVVLMALRARYPFELEWIEGAAVNSVQWILSGHFLYERPALEFTPLIYNLLYFYVSAAFAALVGPGFLAPRLVSILATLGCCWLIFALVRQETRNWKAALAAAGFYAATFKMTGIWMDVARADSLLVLFLVLAAYVVRRKPGRIGALMCAAVLALAYFTKQSALPFFVAFGGFYLLERRREWLVFWPAAFALTVGVTLWVDALSGGWYSFYTWYIVGQHVLDAERIRAFWQTDLLGNVPLALIAALAALALLGNPFRRSAEGSRSRFYWAFTATTLAVSWWNRAAAGAHTNTLMPFMACLGILIGLMLGRAKPVPRPRSASAHRAALGGGPISHLVV